MGLQGYDVSSNAPSTNNTLVWNGSAWVPHGMTVPNLSAVGSNAAPQDFLSGYRSGAILRYLNTTTVEVSSGEVMVNGYMRRNTSAVNVAFSGSPAAPTAGWIPVPRSRGRPTTSTRWLTTPRPPST